MFNMTFTDAQGVTHTDAVFEVVNAYYNANNSIYEEGEPSASRSAGYRARYWPSAAAHAEGRPPYLFVDLSGRDTFVFNPSSDLTTADEVVAAAEQHLQAVVLPSLLGQTPQG